MMTKTPDVSNGFTLPEVLVTSALFAILIVLITPIFQLVQQSFTSADARSNLKTSSQKAINNMGQTLTECKRLFQNVTSDVNFLNRVQFSGVPFALGGSRLPLNIENGTLSPATTNFVTTAVGNSLFFASINQPQDMVVTDSLSNISSIRIDTYHFNYFYLAPDFTQSIGGQSKINRWEWHSVNFADYNQLMNITDGTKQANTAKTLFTSGIQLAWNPSVSTATAAFYLLDGSGNITASPSQMIIQATASKMIKILTVTPGGGYRYGVSPNTGGSFTTSKPVPLFGTAGGNFPSGLEVVTVGPNGTRQVLIRLVLVAEGSFKGDIAHEQLVVTNIRDLW